MRHDFKVRAGNSGTLTHDAGLAVVVKARVDNVVTVFDLTGYEIVFTVRAAPDTAPVLRKSSSDGSISVNLVTGEVLVPLSPTETRNMLGSTNSRSLIYELERKKASPVVQRPILYGEIVVIAGANDD